MERHILMSNRDHGTREAGACLRRSIIDAIDNNPKAGPFIFDFEGVACVSSGWADEAIGKLIQWLGIVTASFMLEFKNVEPTVRVIIDKATLQRLTESI